MGCVRFIFSRLVFGCLWPHRERFGNRRISVGMTSGLRGGCGPLLSVSPDDYMRENGAQSRDRPAAAGTGTETGWSASSPMQTNLTAEETAPGEFFCNKCSAESDWVRAPTL